MPFSSGSFGPFEILAPLGAGGMGEVYRARDSRLGREVALKVLPEELSRDEGRLSRFEKEARAASALNHPNIVTVYEIGEVDSTAYIAMELVDGKTLREVAAWGPLPIRRVLNLAAQVAEGLAKAHSVGIVHRDLKPENVMVSKDGFVKILDFGLAKLIEPQSGDVTGMPTMGETRTQPGTVMGTVAYMSPEQASGASLDFRSDQFSFGSILYEALTGEKAFTRKTAAETMSAIIREDAKPIATLRPEVPAPLRWIVERCLAKDPEERYAATRDLARDLAEVRDHISEVASGAAASVENVARRKRRSVPFLVAAGALLLGAAGSWLLLRAERPAVSPTFRRLTFRVGTLHNARFTPDGQTVVYGARWLGERRDVYAVRPESPESRSLGLDGDILGISSSGEMAIRDRGTGFYGMVSVIPFAGGALRSLVEGVPYAGADWTPTGKELAVTRAVEGRERLEFPIGKVLYEGGTGSIRGPRFSPAGDRIAFLHEEGPRTGSVMTIGSSGGTARKLAGGWPVIGPAACWTADGKEIWFSAARQLGYPAAIRAVDFAGRERTVLQTPGDLELYDVARDGRVLLAHHAITGSLWGLAPGDAAEREITWFDRPQPRDLSRDGRTVLFSERGEGGGETAAVYLRRLDGAPAVRLGDGVGFSLSPDGSSVLAGLSSAPVRLLILPTGAGQTRTLNLTGFDQAGPGAWMPDGRSVVFAGREQGKRDRIYLLAIDGGAPRPISPEGVTFPFRQSGPVSPDGRWFVGEHEGGISRYPIAGGTPQPMAGIERGEQFLRWGADARSVFLSRGPEGAAATLSWGALGPTKVWSLDPDTGKRTLWKEIKPADPGAIIAQLVISADGRSYVYSTRRSQSVLYLVEGLR